MSEHYADWNAGIRVHQTALIGEPPQMNEWEDGDPVFAVVIGDDVEVGAYSCIDGGWERSTVIGKGSWVMKQVHVAHDCILGERVVVASGSVLGGYVEIGDDSKIGLSVVVLPYRKIGKGCVIGAGAVVTRNVPDGEIFVGNPARPRGKRSSLPFSERELLEHVGKV